MSMVRRHAAVSNASLADDSPLDRPLLQSSNEAETSEGRDEEESESSESPHLSTLSNRLFLVGSLLFFAQSLAYLWDKSFYFIGILGAFCYVLDFAWECKAYYDYYREYEDEFEEPASAATGNSSAKRLYAQLMWLFGSKELATIMTFGVGAIFEWLAMILYCFEWVKTANAIEKVSLHSYLLHTLIVLWPLSTIKCCDPRNLLRRLLKLGDILFFLGSLIDVSLSYWYTDGKYYDDDDGLIARDDSIVDRGNLLSSLLWLANAILYNYVDYKKLS